MAYYISRGVRVTSMVTASRKARATRFAALGELAARSKAQASLLVYGKKKTRPRRKRTPKRIRILPLRLKRSNR